MSDRLRYPMVIEWSNDDGVYVVTLPGWDGRVFNPVTHGDTYDEAIRNGHEALEALVASATKRGEPLPEPRDFVPVGSGSVGA